MTADGGREVREELEEKLERAAEIINSSGRVVAFTGAGVSQESGIPTFRDPGGLWDRFDPYELGGGDVFSALAKGSGFTGRAADFLEEMIVVLERAEPNPGHRALVDLERMGILRSVITQNIDDLHRRAGNSRVIEVHGNAFRMLCLSCGRRFFMEKDELFGLGREVVRLLRDNDLAGVLARISLCGCGGPCRLDVVGFGEPVQQMGEAIHEARTCDCLLVLGTSGEVFPANTIPSRARESGARVIEINASHCCFSGLVDVGIVGRTGEILPRIVEKVARWRGYRG